MKNYRVCEVTKRLKDWNPESAYRVRISEERKKERKKIWKKKEKRKERK